MGDGQEVQLHIRGHSTQGDERPLPSPEEAATVARHPPSPPPPYPMFKQWKWWLMVVPFILFVLGGQTVATLLGRLYYNEGGNSKWMATLVQSGGSPVLLLPLLFFRSSRMRRSRAAATAPPAKIASIYLALGLLIGGDNLMYSYGLLYLPLSTYSLICATQLAFNAVFSFFLNAQRFTLLIFNSVVLLTFSAALLGVRSDSDDSAHVSKSKYPLGFLLTLGASATFSFILSLTQVAFEKVMQRADLAAVLELQLCSNSVAACTSVVGLFASGEWGSIGGEMEAYGKGKVSYVMTLVWTAVSWQVASVGTVGLIFVVSSLFSNVISTLALPVVPIFAVVFFHDKMDGVKMVALLIATWGFVSYVYQHYLDDKRAKKAAENGAGKMNGVMASP